MITQENKLFAIGTPLGEDVLALSSFSGSEGISSLFSFNLTLLSENHNIVFEDIIGKNVTVSMRLPHEELRYFNGIISYFSQGQDVDDENADLHHLASYTATMVPWFWLLTCTVNSRIFQDLSVPDIVEQIFSEKGFLDYELRLHGSYDPRIYCVQYRESDFDFVNRMLEEEGIYYFFEHENAKHTLILADTPDENKAYPFQEIARFRTESSRTFLDEDMIDSLERSQEITFGKYTVNDFNFTMPTSDLKVEVVSQQSLGPGDRELYDYPSEFENRARGDVIANLRMQAEEARTTSITGQGNCRGFVSGCKFTLMGYSRAAMNEKDYVLTSVTHSITQSIGPSDGEDDGGTYTNTFSCIPFEIPFRPMLSTPKPIIAGSQTAIVVGPAGEEIYPDEHGRVKVQFHWDRLGQYDDKSSCWIRVSQSIAGSGWGAIHLPRIGQEVIVDFLEGDPDRPIITGRVYHGLNMPPYPLPDEKTKSTIKTNSSPGGGGYNEICFEDKKGKERIYIHAERSQHIRVKGDLHESIGNDTHLTVKKNQLEKIEGDRHQIILGNHNERVDGTVSRQTGMDVHEQIGMNHAMEVGTDIHIKAGMNIVVEAGLSITLKAGSNFVMIDPSGVTIVGSMIKLNSGGSAGSGAGSSPTDPEEPVEAGTAGAGKTETPKSQKSKLPAPPPMDTTPSDQAKALKNASESGTPFCEA